MATNYGRATVPNGTVLVRDINSGAGDGAPRYLTNVNGTLFLSRHDGTNGRELWRSNGTSTGTTRCEHQLGANDASPQSLINVNGTLYFSAPPMHQWRRAVEERRHQYGDDPGAEYQSRRRERLPGDLTNIGGTLYFSAIDGTNGAELWKSNGTSTGTVMVRNIGPGATSATRGF